MARPNITAEQFDEIAVHCNRWATKSLDIARILIVEGKPLADVANQHNCSTAYANIIRARFYNKAQQVRLETFKHQVKSDELAALKPYGDDIEKLSAEGFNDEQLVEYLKQNNVSVSPDTVNKFLARAIS